MFLCKCQGCIVCIKLVFHLSRIIAVVALSYTTSHYILFNNTLEVKYHILLQINGNEVQRRRGHKKKHTHKRIDESDDILYQKSSVFGIACLCFGARVKKKRIQLSVVICHAHKTSLRGFEFIQSLFQTFQSTFVLTDINRKLGLYVYRYCNEQIIIYRL